MKVATTQKNGVKDSRTEDGGMGGREPCVFPTCSCCSFVDLLAIGYPWDSPIYSNFHPTSKTPQKGEITNYQMTKNAKPITCQCVHATWCHLAYLSCKTVVCNFVCKVVLFAKDLGKTKIY